MNLVFMKQIEINKPYPFINIGGEFVPRIFDRIMIEVRAVNYCLAGIYETNRNK